MSLLLLLATALAISSGARAAITAPQASLDDLVTTQGGFGSTFLRDLLDLADDEDLNNLYYGPLDGVVLLPSGQGSNAKKLLALLENLSDADAAALAARVARYHIIPKGVAPSSLWTAANYTNYIKPRVVASTLEANTTGANANLTFLPQYFSLANVPPFIQVEWAFASKPRVYGAWGGAGYDPTRVGAVQGADGSRGGTVYALDDVLIPPTNGSVIPVLGNVWGGLNDTMFQGNGNKSVAPELNGAAAARKVATYTRAGANGDTTYTTFPAVFDRVVPLSVRRALQQLLGDPNSVYTLFLPTYSAITTYMRANNIRSPANIPTSVLARHVVVNQTLFVADLFAGPPRAGEFLAYLTTFNNGTLVLNRTMETIPVAPTLKTPVLYEVCVDPKTGALGKQSVVSTQLVGTGIIAGKAVIHFINSVLGTAKC